jgi:rare lipoprotein A
MTSSLVRGSAHRTALRGLLVSAAALSLAACATGHAPSTQSRHRPADRPKTARAPAAKPAARGDGAGERALGRYKVGAPYQAAGLWYVPAEQPDYNEVGIASWYGDEFNGKPTANGERFDMDAISAAHTTLPIPSIIEVTNLENGRVIQVRLNDRGPFKPGRIIDLSHAAATALGYAGQGTAKVRVRYVGPAPLYDIAPQTVAVRTERREAPAPRPLPPPMVEGPPAGFAVQAGAFADRGNAERVLARLRGAGDAAIRPLERNGALLYRVVVGPWTDEADAWSALQRVADLGFDQARIVRF